MLFSSSSAFAAYPVPFKPASTLSQIMKRLGFSIESTSLPIPSSNVIAPKFGKSPTPTRLAPVRTNAPTAPLIKNAEKNKKAVIKMRVGKSEFVVGTANSSNDGKLQVPAFSFKKPGSYIVEVEFSPNRCAKIAIQVKAK